MTTVFSSGSASRPSTSAHEREQEKGKQELGTAHSVHSVKSTEIGTHWRGPPPLACHTCPLARPPAPHSCLQPPSPAHLRSSSPASGCSPRRTAWSSGRCQERIGHFLTRLLGRFGWLGTALPAVHQGGGRKRRGWVGARDVHTCGGRHGNVQAWGNTGCNVPACSPAAHLSRVVIRYNLARPPGAHLLRLQQRRGEVRQPVVAHVAQPQLLQVGPRRQALQRGRGGRAGGNKGGDVQKRESAHAPGASHSCWGPLCGPHRTKAHSPFNDQKLICFCARPNVTHSLNPINPSTHPPPTHSQTVDHEV